MFYNDDDGPNPFDGMPTWLVAIIAALVIGFFGNAFYKCSHGNKYACAVLEE